MAASTTMGECSKSNGLLDAAAFSDAIGGLEVPWRLRLTAQEFSARVRRRSFSGATLGEMRFGPCTGVRDQSEISRDSADFVCISHLRQGSMTFHQGDRQLSVKPGDMLLWDGATPSMFNNLTMSEFELIWLPRALVERRIGPLGARLCHTTPGTRGSGKLLSQHLHSLHALIETLDGAMQQQVIEATVDLIFACFALNVEQPAAMSVNQAALLCAAKKAISRRIGNGHVPLADVAQSLGISARYLQKIFTASGQTFSAEVMTQRARLARKLLVGARARSIALTDVAHSAGYCDLSHFNREFRRHYGTSPSKYREG